VPALPPPAAVGDEPPVLLRPALAPLLPAVLVLPPVALAPLPPLALIAPLVLLPAFPDALLVEPPLPLGAAPALAVCGLARLGSCLECEHALSRERLSTLHM
jgi:hypothetical protein